jgi:hypothetical protein
VIRAALVCVFMLFAGAASAQPQADGSLVISDPSVFINAFTPDEYILMSIHITEAASARPKTKTGRVVLIRLSDPTDVIEIPWIDGRTAIESLRAWRKAVEACGP